MFTDSMAQAVLPFYPTSPSLTAPLPEAPSPALVITYNYELFFHPTKTGFFSLPRELRDTIYSYSLFEPTSWYRRHQPGCPYHSLTAGSETPIFRCQREEYRCRTYAYLNDYDEWCGWSRTKTLIYNEAIPIFLSQNLFCFVRPGDLVSAFGSKSDWYLSHVRRISLLEKKCHYTGLFNLVAIRNIACALIARMMSLVELEIPPWWAPHGIEWLRPLSQLRHLRGVALASMWVIDTGLIWVRVAKDLAVPGCQSLERHERLSRHFGCLVCWTTTLAGVEWRTVWKHSRQGPFLWRYKYDVVWQLEGPVSREYQGSSTPGYDGREVRPAAADWARDRGFEVGVFGLPVNGPETRLKLVEDEDEEGDGAERARGGS